MLNSLFVFDIETIPDTSVLYELTGSETTDPVLKRQELEEYSRKVSGDNPFPRQLFHSVVSISCLSTKIENIDNYEYYRLEKIGSLSRLEYNEKEITEEFFNFLCRRIPRIVSYNGRSFDLPVMKYRAMKFGISVENLFKSGDKWNSYSSRYSTNWHCDLLETLSDFGTSARPKMNEVCSILGIPGKIGVDGSKVSEMFDKEQFKDIDNYCETDVLNTYLIYLNYALLTGIINYDGFTQMNKDLIKYLEEQKASHFDEFLAEWKRVDSRGLFADM